MKTNTLKILVGLASTLIFITTSCDKDDKAGIFPKPEITSISQPEALVGTPITITGKGLKDVVRVDFASVPAASFDPASNTDTEITVSVPEGLKYGVADIAVYYGGPSEANLGATATIPFKVLYPPTISLVSPLSAKPGYSIIIKGDYLSDATEVTFGATPATFEVTPETFTMTIVVPDINAPGTLQLKITSPGGSVNTPFTVMAKTPEVYSFAPQVAMEKTEITLNGLFLNNVTSVKVGTKETQFTVVNPTTIKFTVPNGATSDKVKVTTALGSIESSSSLTVSALPKITSMSPVIVKPGDDLAINGLNLDMVAGVYFPGLAVPVTTFISQSSTKIRLVIPVAAATNGPLKFKAINGLEFDAGASIALTIDDPSALAFVFFDDAFTNGYGDWSWGTGRVSDTQNTEQIKSGTKSWKMTFPAADAGLSWGGGSEISTTSYTKFSFSVFGGPGTEGHTLDVVINDTWSGFPNVTIKEGQWTQFDMLFTQFPGTNIGTKVTRIILRSPGQAGTVWVDKVGFK